MTLAPAASNSSITEIAGENRVSSVFALKANPQTATFFPFKEPSKASLIFFTIRTCAFKLLSSAASRRGIGTFFSLADSFKALTSFGKHIPPQPGPGLRNSLPILLSNPMACKTSSALASVDSA